MKNFFVFFAAIVLLISCNSGDTGSQTHKTDSLELSGEITIFNAGSLSMVLRELKKEFEIIYPKVKILIEPAGSLTCARKIIDLKKDCDIFASADYKIIDEMIIPEYANKNIRFASNEIVVAFKKGTKYFDEINSNNWYEILGRNDVIFGRAEPDNDPCGYRTVLMWQLSEIYYKNNKIEDILLSKNKEYVRPKAIDLAALVESNSVDYVFEYKSIAMQYNLDYILLPAEINLSSSEMSRLYQKSSIEVKGKKPGETVVFTGEPIIYGISLLKNSKNKTASQKFIDFLLSDKGKKIIERAGFRPL